jgi:hypothetical protein
MAQPTGFESGQNELIGETPEELELNFSHLASGLGQRLGFRHDFLAEFRLPRSDYDQISVMDTGSFGLYTPKIEAPEISTPDVIVFRRQNNMQYV